MPSTVILSAMQPVNLRIHYLGSMNLLSVHSLHSAHSLFLCSLSWFCALSFSNSLSLSNSRSSALPLYLGEVSVLSDTPNSQHRRSLSCIRVVSFHITVQRSHSSMYTPPPLITSSPLSPPQRRSRDQGMKTSDLLAPSDRPPPRLYARSDWPQPRLCSQ